MACTSFVWKDSGKRWDYNDCCSSCHEDVEYGYHSLPDTELTQDDDPPGYDAFEVNGKFYVEVCCRLTGDDREHLRYSPEKDDDG